MIKRKIDSKIPQFALCHCTGIGRQRVLHAVAQGCRTVAEVQAATGACTGCRCCRPELEQLLADPALIPQQAPSSAG